MSFLTAEKRSTVYVYHVIFIHSSIDEHLGCFRILATVNNLLRFYFFLFNFDVFYLFFSFFPLNPLSRTSSTVLNKNYNKHRRVDIFLISCFHFLWRYTQKWDSCYHMLVLFQNALRALILFSIVATLTCIPPTV